MIDVTCPKLTLNEKKSRNMFRNIQPCIQPHNWIKLTTPVPLENKSWNLHNQLLLLFWNVILVFPIAITFPNLEA